MVVAAHSIAAVCASTSRVTTVPLAKPRDHVMFAEPEPWAASLVGAPNGLSYSGCLQNAMTSSEERTSAEAEGYRIERALMDCVAPPRRGGGRNPSVSSSRFLVAKGDFRHGPMLTSLYRLSRNMSINVAHA